MGQKVNPVGLRVGINRGWDSIWFAKKREYGKLLIEDYKIRTYVKKNVINSGVSQVIIERTSKKCIVTIYTSRPGFVIGKKGADVEKIKKNVSKITSSEVSLNIKEIKKPELNAYLVAVYKKVIDPEKMQNYGAGALPVMMANGVTCPH